MSVEKVQKQISQVWQEWTDDYIKAKLKTIKTLSVPKPPLTL